MAGREESRVFVGGLASHTKAHHLTEAFSRFGTVLKTEIAVDKQTGRFRRFGFITFTNPHAARAAIRQMHNTELHGHTITVNRAYPRTSSNVEYNYNNGDGGTSGTNYNNSCFKCGRTGHWARDCTYPREVEFNNSYSGYHGGPHFSNKQFFDSYNANQRRHNGCKNAGNRCFNCGRTGHWARDCLNPRDGRPRDLLGKSPESPNEFDYKDFDQLDYDDFTIYCDHCEDFGHSFLECPNLGFFSTCDCDDGPDFHEELFDGSCMQCGGFSLRDLYDNLNSSTREHGESSSRPRFSGKRSGGRQKGYYDPFGLDKLFEEVFFGAHGQPGNSNGRNPSGGDTCFQNSRGRNNRPYDAFEEEVFENHGQQGNHKGRTMSRGAHMGGERSGRRENHARKNDQFDRFDKNEYDGGFHEGRGVCGQNSGAQSQSRPSGPHTSSRRPTGGSSRRPRNSARGGGRVTHESRDDANERRRRGKDPINVFIFVEKGGRS